MPVNPLKIRDFSRGVIRKSSVSNDLVPLNSVAHSINVNYDEIIGAAKVRKGTTLLGAVVSAGSTPLGLTEFVGANDSPNTLISIFTGALNATIYFYDTAISDWGTSTVTNLDNNAKVRTAVFNDRVFIVNGITSARSSLDIGNDWNYENTPNNVIPSLIFRTKERLICAGVPAYPDRVYFSSVIDPTAAPFITWNNDNDTGDFIDINPNDGSNITGFAESSNQTLIFKEHALYRMNVISKTVDNESISNVGAVSQEGITTCQGIVYFFSGIDIRRTNGGYPEQISRLGVQDWIDAIPQANWKNVVAGQDGWNVTFAIGDITLNENQDNERTYKNVELKFSTRDETWSVHSKADRYRAFANYTTETDGRKMVGAERDGAVQTIDKGTTDNTTPIYYELETQEQEFGNRFHLKKISDKLSVICQYGLDGAFQAKENDGDFKDLNITLNKRVNIGQKINLEGNFFTFRWYGNSSQKAPILEGIYVENITDLGFIKK